MLSQSRFYFTLGFFITIVNIKTIYGGQDCLSCGGVESVNNCQHHVTCNINEVCYKHVYRTESGSSLLDLGCSLPEFCRHSLSGIFGRRSEGHHIVCESCCNNTRLCNRDVQCKHSINTGGNLPRECADIKANNTDGVYNIYPDSSSVAVPVFCDMTTENKKWTVIQRRYNGSVEFYRNWNSYKEGFGYPNGEYWIGNQVIHEITDHGNHELRIDMSDFDGKTRFAKYSSFSIGDEKNGYRLHVTNYTGDAGDSLSYHSGKMFSTFDVNHDIDQNSCAIRYKGAWWYGLCHDSNLNGKYLAGHTSTYADGVVWDKWHGDFYSLKTVTMMIRRHNV